MNTDRADGVTGFGSMRTVQFDESVFPHHHDFSDLGPQSEPKANWGARDEPFRRVSFHLRQ